MKRVADVSRLPQTISWAQMSTLCARYDLFCGDEFIFCGNKFIFRKDELIFCGNKLVFHGNKLIIHIISITWPQFIIHIIILFIIFNVKSRAPYCHSFLFDNEIHPRHLHSLAVASSTCSANAKSIFSPVVSEGRVSLTEYRAVGWKRVAPESWKTDGWDFRVTILRLVVRFHTGWKKKKISR